MLNEVLNNHFVNIIVWFFNYGLAKLATICEHLFFGNNGANWRS